MNGKSVALLALCMVASTGAGVGFGRAHWKRPPVYDFQTAFERRAEVIADHSKQMLPGQMVVVGDSIVERQRFGQLCGLDVLNDGISSTSAADLQRVAIAPAVAAHPSRAVFAAGVNTFVHHDSTTPAEYGATVHSILDRLPARPIIVGIGPIVGQEAQIEAFNGVLRGEASRRHGSYVEPLPANLKTDGVHPTVSGMREWQARVERACH